MVDDLTLAPDTDVNAYAQVARDLLALLWRGGKYGAFWSMSTKRTRWHVIGSALTVPTGLDLYFGVHPVASIPPRNSAGEDVPPEMVCTRNDLVESVNCLYAEFDTKDWPSREAMLWHIENLPPPNYTQSSGGGVHAFWIFDQPVMITDDATRKRMALAQADWVSWVRGDWGARDLRRILRVPGTYNGKLPDNPREVAPLVTAYEGAGALYSSQLLLEMLDDQYSRAKRAEEDCIRRQRAMHEATRPRSFDDGKRAGEVLAQYLAGQTDMRNAKSFWAACRLAQQGYTRDDIDAALFGAAVSSGLTEKEVRATFGSAWGRYN